MRANFRNSVPVLFALLATPASVLADVTSEQSTIIVRGSGNRVLRGLSVGETGISSTIYVHGERMLRTTGKLDELIDLELQSVTQIRHDKKTYCVLTFDQYRQAWHIPAPGATKPDAPATGGSKFDLRVDDTNRTKRVNGVELRQMLINVTQDLSETPTPDAQPMEFSLEALIAPDNGGTDEFSEFNKNLAEKLGSSVDLSQFPVGMSAAMRQGLMRLIEESQQLHGVLIEQSTRVTGPAGAGFDSGPAGQKRDLGKQTKSQAARVGRGLGNVFGRVAGGVISNGPGGNVPTPDKAPIPTSQAPDDSARPKGESGDLIEMTVRVHSFNNEPVVDSRFALPADYQKVACELPTNTEK
jgi:hypothetical protein